MQLQNNKFNGSSGRFHLACHLFVLLSALISLIGCTGLQTFSQSVMPGDTVAIAIGRQPNVSREQATIVIQESGGAHLLAATDPGVRAWVNLYPDPVSRIVVGRETSQSLGVSASAWGIGIDNETGSDKDWFETVIFVDLPQDIAPGQASIDVRVSGASILPQPVALNVLPQPAGTPHSFETNEWGPLVANQFLAMERGDHYTVTFTGGSTVPAAVQVEMSHAPDADHGGAGQAYVVHPRGDIKSLVWTDSGTVLRVIITPAWHKTLEDQQRSGVFNPETLQSFKFYVAGGITGLQITSVSAFDRDGNLLPGISASLQ